MTSIKTSLQLFYIIGLGILLFSGCRSQKTSNSLPIEPSESFTYSGDQYLTDRWWTSFDDANLNRLMDSAMASNFDLQTAWERLQAAQALVNREKSLFYPSLDATLNAEMSSPRPNESLQDRNIRLGISSVYEVDLWGRIRSGVEAEQYRAQAVMANYRAAAISLSAEITRTWFQLAEAGKQTELIDSQIQTNEKMLRLIRARFGSGQIRSVDILRQKQLLESSREQRIMAEAREEVLEHQLAILLSRQPQENLAIFPDSLPEMPPLPQTGIPIELVQRRPDVQSAYHLLEASDRDLAAAISNRYPRLTLTASLSSTTNNVENIFENWAYSVAGNLLAPIFYGGELKAEAERMEAIKQQQLYNYGQIVLIAFREVEDALIREKKQLERIESLKQQLILTEQSYEQLRIEYFNGMSDYLDVLVALDEIQQLQRNLLNANLQLLEYRIALYRALSGGFKTENK